MNELMTHWNQAKTPSEVGELTALWLEGQLRDDPIPGHPTEVPDEETDELIPTLANLNRWGFITGCSQPGSSDETWPQRAFVDGFAGIGAAEDICNETNRTRLVTLAYSPDQPRVPKDQWLRIPVTLDGEKENTWVGSCMSSAVVRLNHAKRYHPAFVDWLATEAWQITIFDPEWSGNDLLWRTLTAVAYRWALTGTILGRPYFRT
jgi:hypothetical protein